MPSVPHGGELVNRVLSEKSKTKILSQIGDFRKLNVSLELAHDLENIATGAFSPLTGFVGRNDYQNILLQGRLVKDIAWTLPILLDVSEKDVKGMIEGEDLLLTYKGTPLAILRLEEIFEYNKEELSRLVFGTVDMKHPGVSKVSSMGKYLLAGKVDFIAGLFSPFSKYRLSPFETRVLFKEKGWKTIVGFQTRNVPHIGHEYVQKMALTFVDGIFINPVIGKKKPGDFRDDIILETYDTLIKNYYLRERAIMAILQTEMRYAGPREAVFHAIVRKNFGCTHFIVGRDHAGVGNFYHPYAAQEIFGEFPDLGIVPLFFKSFFFCKKCGSVANEKTCPHDKEYHMNFEGTKIREMLTMKRIPPPEIMRPEVTEIILKRENPFVV